MMMGMGEMIRGQGAAEAMMGMTDGSGGAVWTGRRSADSGQSACPNALFILKIILRSFTPHLSDVIIIYFSRLDLHRS